MFSISISQSIYLYRSPIVWEQRKKNRWKALPMVMCEALEEGYDNYSTGKGSVKEKILDKEVSFIHKSLLRNVVLKLCLVYC